MATLTMPERNISVHFGALNDSIQEQLKKQGFKFNEKEVELFQSQLDAIHTLRFANILVDSQANKCFDKLYKKILRHVLKANGLREIDRHAKAERNRA